MSTPKLKEVTLSDRYRAAERSWRPSHCRGAVLYLHGIQSHGGWYEESAAHLADAGFAVDLPDRRGSGLNEAARGHLDSAERGIADVEEHLAALLRETDQPRAHLVAVSWGGKLACCLAGRRPGEVASLTLVGPGLFPKLDLSASQKLGVALSLIHDRHRPFQIPLNDPRLFTANPERIRFVEEDRLRLLQVTAAFLIASRRLDREALRLRRTAFCGPVHLMLAGQDQIIDNERTRAWLRELPSRDKQITHYPDAHHTLEFEPDPSAFRNDLRDWLMVRSAPAASPGTVPAR